VKKSDHIYQTLRTRLWSYSKKSLGKLKFFLKCNNLRNRR
jgi:hypothetical protein